MLGPSQGGPHPQKKETPEASTSGVSLRRPNCSTDVNLLEASCRASLQVSTMPTEFRNSDTLFPLPFAQGLGRKSSSRAQKTLSRGTGRSKKQGTTGAAHGTGRKKPRYDDHAKTKAKCPQCRGIFTRTTVRHDGSFSYRLLVCDNVHCAIIISALPIIPAVTGRSVRANITRQ
jgi:hypothetical protein